MTAKCGCFVEYSSLVGSVNQGSVRSAHVPTFSGVQEEYPMRDEARTYIKKQCQSEECVFSSTFGPLGACKVKFGCCNV